MAQVTKLAKAELAEIRERQAEMSERLIIHYRSVLACLDPRSAGESAEALRMARRTVEQAGGFEAELADIEAVAAHHANNYMPLVARHRRRDRATMFAFTRVVELEATSADRSVLDAVEHACAHAHLTRDFIPDHRDGAVVDLSFASEQWQRVVCDHDQPGRLNRRHFEACVFTYLASELRTGDVAVRGSQAYANWAARQQARQATCCSAHTARQHRVTTRAALRIMNVSVRERELYTEAGAAGLLPCPSRHAPLGARSSDGAASSTTRGRFNSLQTQARPTVWSWS